MLRGKKKLDAYIKLLEIFERELKKHHVFFSAGGYEIRYIITSKVFEEKFDVEITLYTKRYRKHHTFLNETKTYYERLKGFAYLFGFKNVQMLRSLDKIKTFKEIYLYNNIGQLLLTTFEKKINLQNLQNGLYYIRILLKDGTIYKEKIIKTTYR